MRQFYGKKREDEEVGGKDPGGEVMDSDGEIEEKGRVGGEVEKLSSEEIGEVEQGDGEGGEDQMDKKGDQEAKEGDAHEKRKE